VFHAVHDAMADRGDRRKRRLPVQPIQQRPDRRAVALPAQALRYATAVGVIDDQPHAGGIDAVEDAAGAKAQRGPVVDREPDARRAGVDRQDAAGGCAHR